MTSHRASAFASAPVYDACLVIFFGVRGTEPGSSVRDAMWSRDK